MERQEELKKLLVSKEFKLEDYKGIAIQEVIILRQTAEKMAEVNKEDPQAVKFFEAKQKFFYHVVMEKLKTLPEIFVLFSQITRMPFVGCDELTFNDQVYVFSEENFAKLAVSRREVDKQIYQIVKFEMNQFLNFYVSLYSVGVNTIMIDEGVNALEIQLEDLCKKPDYSHLPADRVPVHNAGLVLTTLYYLQELRKKEEKKSSEELKELEEEMLVNMRRSTFLVPIQVDASLQEEEYLSKETKNIQVPFMRYENGDSYQPIFTDPYEFAKFNRENKFRAVAVPYANLGKIIVDPSKGLVINPQGYHLLLVKGQLKGA